MKTFEMKTNTKKEVSTIIIHNQNLNGFSAMILLIHIPKVESCSLQLLQSK